MTIRRCVIVALALGMVASICLAWMARFPMAYEELQSLDDRDPSLADWYRYCGPQSGLLLGYTGPWPPPSRHVFTFQSGSGTRFWAVLASGKLLAAVAIPRGQGPLPPEVVHGAGPFRYIVTDLPSRLAGVMAALASASPSPALNADLRAYTICLPVWALIVAFGACPLVAFVRGPVRRAYRRSSGRCVRCGYDLTGVEAARCPECAARFNPARRGRAVARMQRRVATALQWPGVYGSRPRRRCCARLMLLFAIAALALWVTSYWRPAMRTPWFNCRIAWGCVAVFGDIAPSFGAGSGFNFEFDGYVGMETWWWPFSFMSRERRWLFLPLWLPVAASVAGWFVLFRPDRHLLARRMALLNPSGEGMATQQAD